MKLCINCKHYLSVDPAQGTHMYGREKELRWKPECGHPKNASVIDGKPKDDLMSLRYGGRCKVYGEWWEAK